MTVWAVWAAVAKGEVTAVATAVAKVAERAVVAKGEALAVLTQKGGATTLMTRRPVGLLLLWRSNSSSSAASALRGHHCCERHCPGTLVWRLVSSEPPPSLARARASRGDCGPASLSRRIQRRVYVAGCLSADATGADGGMGPRGRARGRALCRARRGRRTCAERGAFKLRQAEAKEGRNRRSGGDCAMVGCGSECAQSRRTR